jgi:hypothetical protein
MLYMIILIWLVVCRFEQLHCNHQSMIGIIVCICKITMIIEFKWSLCLFRAIEADATRLSIVQFEWEAYNSEFLHVLKCISLEDVMKI